MSMEVAYKLRNGDRHGRTTVIITGLSMPQAGDCVTVVRSKLSALAAVIRNGQSISVATDYAAITTQEGNPIKAAMAEMRPDEAFAWDLYSEGKYPLPDFDWEKDREKDPVNLTPRKNAQHRAEALNRIYRTDKAGPGHSVWMMKNKPYLLPLVKAVARVIGAERSLHGGQVTRGAIQLADIESINKILAVSAQLLANTRGNPTSFEVNVAMRTLSSHRAKLRGLRGRRRSQGASSTLETHR